MYASAMMTELLDYMKISVEEVYNEHEYYTEAESLWKHNPEVAERLMKSLETAHQELYYVSYEETQENG